MTELRPRAYLVVSAKGDESVHGHRAAADLYAVHVHGLIDPLVKMSDHLAAMEALRVTMTALVAERRK